MAGRIMGVSPPTWDAQGNARAQGSVEGIVAAPYETTGAVSATFTLATAGTTSAGVYDSNGNADPHSLEWRKVHGGLCHGLLEWAE